MTASALKLDDIVMTITPEIQEAIAEVFPGRKNLYPLCQQHLSFELDKVPPSVSNAFQRVMTQELQGYAFHLDMKDVSTKRDGLPVDPFMCPEFMQLRIQTLPIRFGLEPSDVEDVTFRIRVQNGTDEIKTIYAGDMKILRGGKSYVPALPFFNPTHELAIVQPGSCLYVDNIRIVKSIGRLFTATSTSIRGRQVPLDIPELPREKTHRGLEGDAKRSGYVPSCFTTMANRHRVTVIIRAAMKKSRRAARLPADACNKILLSLRTIRGVIERGDERRALLETHRVAGVSDAGAAEEDNNFWIIQKVGESLSEPTANRDTSSANRDTSSEKVRGVLHLRGESETITELLRVEISSLVPDLAFVGGDPRYNTDSIQFTVDHHCTPEDLSKLLQQTVTNLVELFSGLEKQFASL
jgi:hypothetical protein